MTQPIQHNPRRRGRIFPEIEWSEEEKAKKEAASEALYETCRATYERIKPDLIDKYHGWFVAVVPGSDRYFLESSKEIAHIKALKAYPCSEHYVFCLNETGACGAI